MLQLRPGCECCDRDLPAESPDAMICSFECTFCRFILTQVLDHGTDHRSQISTILTSIGVTAPRLDGWAYGRAAGRIVSAAGPPV